MLEVFFMQIKRVKVFISIFFLALGGCTSPYKQFYFDRTGGADLTKASGFILDDNVTIKHGVNKDNDNQKLLEEGYSLVGFSSFNAATGNESDAIAQAKEVHASLVMLYEHYSNTITGNIPLSVPTQQTTTVNTLLGSASTTTYGQDSFNIPYSVNRSEYLALYYIKSKSAPTLGLHVIDLTDKAKKEIQSNKGVLVLAVLKNSPAFFADFLKDDIITRINEQVIIIPKDYSDAMQKFTGQKVVITLFRDSKEIKKEVQLNRPNS
jgi:hypothetical protein